MPLYEYRCPRCGHTFEQLVPANRADGGTVCPACGHTEAERLPSTFGAGRSRCAPDRPT